MMCLDNFLTGAATNVDHLRERERFRLVRADVSDFIHVVGLVDAVFHFASPASPIDYRLPIHAEGRIDRHSALAGSGQGEGCPFPARVDVEVYGDPQVHPRPETYWGNVSPVGPRGVYDEAKRFAEALTVAYRQTHGVDTAIIRIFNTFGPRMRPTMAGRYRHSSGRL